MPAAAFPGAIVDYGHGVETPGKRYTFLDDDGSVLFEIREYQTNRAIALCLMRILLQAGVRVYDCVADREWTQETLPQLWSELEQSDVPLGTRTGRANKRPDWLLVSVHSNAIGYSNVGPSLDARGGVIYTSPGDTLSDLVAEALHNAFVRVFEHEPVYMRDGDLSDGDHDREARFHMLVATIGAAVLGEILYFVNRDDALFLLSEHGQEVIAAGYAAGLLPFFTPGTALADAVLRFRNARSVA